MGLLQAETVTDGGIKVVELHLDQGVAQIDALQAETVTEKGIRTVGLYTGQSIAKILRHISRSKANQALPDTPAGRLARGT